MIKELFWIVLAAIGLTVFVYIVSWLSLEFTFGVALLFAFLIVGLVLTVIGFRRWRNIR